MPIVEVNGQRLYHERRGEGPRLLFVNGSGATLETTAPLLDPLAASFDLLAYDQRGLGRSPLTEGPSAESYHMADLAADAAGLLDAVGWATCRVMGVSFGGMVAQEIAVTWPERVERLALLCTSPGGAGGSSYPIHELASLPPAERAARSVGILDTRFSPEWLASHPVDRALAELFLDRAQAPRPPQQRAGEAAQLQARRHHDVWDRLDAITCPTFIGCGRFDPLAPPVNSENLASRVTHAELHGYEGGHVFWVQDPTALPEVVAFLGRDAG
jgi:3-oxoadipate enol-lactonase